MEYKTATKPGCADAALAAWLARYEPVEREIMLACEKRRQRRASKRERQAKSFGDLCEATGGFAVVMRREGWSATDMLNWAGGDALTINALTRWLRKDAAQRVNKEQNRLRRPLYYAREKERRAVQAVERRRISLRRTNNPCPTREDVLEAWIHRRESHEAALCFGSMIHDLECYVDNSLMRNESGAIIGRRGGVKEWLKENIPVLHLRYTTVMRYKAMAKKFKQIAVLADPTPAAAIIPPKAKTAQTLPLKKRLKGDASIAYAGSSTPDGISTAEVHVENADKGRKTVDGVVADAGCRQETVHIEQPVPDLAVVRARAIWEEIVKDLRPSATALIDRIDALTDPERVEDANMLAEWKAKYKNEITVRRKSRWWRRLLKKGMSKRSASVCCN